jgi:hypothetical protein
LRCRAVTFSTDLPYATLADSAPLAAVSIPFVAEARAAVLIVPAACSSVRLCWSSASLRWSLAVEALWVPQALQDILNGPAPADAAKAAEDLSKAHDDSAEAAIRERAAQDAANMAQGNSTLTADQQAQALIDLNRAKYGVTDATAAEAAAAKALYDLQHEADAGICSPGCRRAGPAAGPREHDGRAEGRG